MSLAVLIPYRPDTPQRARIQETTRRLWARQGIEVVYADDGLTGQFFSYARAANRARARTDADCLIVYNVDALPLPPAALAKLHIDLSAGMPWSTIFDGQQRFTLEQTERLIAGADPAEVGPAEGPVAMGREALLAVRADVWDDLRGMDERFIGWGPEDAAWHYILKTLHPDGNDTPAYGLFQSLAHPQAPQTEYGKGAQILASYQAQPAHRLRAYYLGRP